MQGGTHAGFLRRLYHGFPDLSRGAVGLALAADLNAGYVNMAVRLMRVSSPYTNFLQQAADKSLDCPCGLFFAVQKCNGDFQAIARPSARPD